MLLFDNVTVYGLPEGSQGRGQKIMGGGACMAGNEDEDEDVTIATLSSGTALTSPAPRRRR